MRRVQVRPSASGHARQADRFNRRATPGRDVASARTPKPTRQGTQVSRLGHVHAADGAVARLGRVHGAGLQVRSGVLGATGGHGECVCV